MVVHQGTSIEHEMPLVECGPSRVNLDPLTLRLNLCGFRRMGMYATGSGATHYGLVITVSNLSNQ